MTDIEPTVEAVARSLAETAIRNSRMFDTPPERVEELLPEAIDHCWHGYVDASRKAIAAYEDAAKRAGMT